MLYMRHEYFSILRFGEIVYDVAASSASTIVIIFCDCLNVFETKLHIYGDTPTDSTCYVRTALSVL